jgi:hypothetical protein
LADLEAFELYKLEHDAKYILKQIESQSEHKHPNTESESEKK